MKNSLTNFINNIFKFPLVGKNCKANGPQKKGFVSLKIHQYKTECRDHPPQRKGCVDPHSQYCDYICKGQNDNVEKKSCEG